MPLAKLEKHSKSSNWVKKAVTFATVTLISLANSFTSLVNYAKSEILVNSESIELKLSNDVIIYGNKLKKQ